MVSRLLYLFITISFSFSSFAQRGRGTIFFSDKSKPVNCQSFSTSFDSLNTTKYFTQCITRFHQKGFLEARIDSIDIDSLNPIAFGYLGQQYKWILASADSISQLWLTDAGINTSRLTRKPISPRSFVNISQNTLRHLEINGHPFASVLYANSNIDSSLVSTELKINPGPLITLDTLYIKGDAKLSKKFIQAHLGFYKGQLFNDLSIGKYDSKLRQLGFISIIRPTEVEFIPGKARIYTYITNKRASQFSGLIGFSSGQDDSPGIKFTGDINLRLINIFQQGEQNTIQWQALGEGTQRLNLLSSWSYISGSKIGLKSQFKLFRRDSTFININPKIAVDFFLSNGSSIGIGFDYRSSSTIAGNASSGLGDVSTSLYQLSYASGIKSEDLFPVSFFWGSTTLGIGTRKTSNNTDELLSKQFSIGELSSIVLGYYPLFNSNVIFHFQIQGEILKTLSSTEQDIIFYDNELYRIGGINTIRGFNQESILANAYGIGTAELQYRLKSLLNFYLFFDYSYVSYHFLSKPQSSWPFGTGFGFQLANAGGVLNLSYALGKGMGEEFGLRTAKVHVGYAVNF